MRKKVPETSPIGFGATRWYGDLSALLVRSRLFVSRPHVLTSSRPLPYHRSQWVISSALLLIKSLSLPIHLPNDITGATSWR